MSDTIPAPPAPGADVPASPRQPRPGLDLVRRDGVQLVALGAVTLVGGGFLAAMLAGQAQGGSGDPWGPLNDLTGAAGNFLLAPLVPRLSRRAARTTGSRVFVRTTQAVTLIGAVCSILMVARRLSFEASTTISLLTVVLQMVWMIWLCRAWRRDRAVPPVIHRSGTAIASGLLVALPLIAGSFVFPFGSPASLALLIPGVVLGGAIYVFWPLWFVRLGLHVWGPRRPTPATTSDDDADADADATT